MRKILLQKTRPYYARVDCGEPYVFFKFLELDDSTEYVLFAKDAEKLAKRFGRDKFPSNLTMSNANGADYFHLDNCAQKKLLLDSYIAAGNFDGFLHIQGDIKPEYRHGKEEAGRAMLDKIFSKDVMPAYVSLRNWTEPCYAALHFSRKLKSTHVIIDPQEAQLSDDKYFFYDNPRINAKYIPFIEYAMYSWAKTANKKQKSKDFTFGFTVLTQDREAIYDEIKKIEEQSMNFLVRYPKKDIETCVKKSLYDEMLEESKYTLIIPSYEATDFSSIRFWEALFRDCVPLVHSSCKWEQAFVEYPEIADVIRSQLLVNTEAISSRVCMDYQVALDAIKGTNDWQKLQSRDWYVEKTRDFFKTLS